MHSGPLTNETLADRYRLDRQIGEGGMGAVYIALDEQTKRRVAVKVLLIEDDEKLAARFEQEARASMELAHPNIVRVTDFHAPKGKAPFLVMELLDGESLRERMKREKRLPIEDAVRIAIELSEALAAAHAAGVIHRDVKPPNVFLVKPHGQVKLLDFGIARVRADFGKVHTTTGTVLGTPSYFAPEQLLAKEIDGRSDVFGVGVVLYEMLAGRRPFDEKNPVDLTAAILNAAPPALEKLRPEVPVPLALIVHDALAKDRTARPTASELAKRLEPFAPKKRSQKRLALVIFALVSTAAAVFAYSSAPSAPSPASPASASIDASAELDGAATVVSASPIEAAADAPVLVPVKPVPRACDNSEEARKAGLKAFYGDVRRLLYECVVVNEAGSENDARMLREACKVLQDRGCVDRVRALHPARTEPDADADAGDGDGDGDGDATDAQSDR